MLDEAHAVRNPKAMTHKAVLALRVTAARWGLTGTPIVNKPEDVQALFAFLRLAPPAIH